MSNNKMNNVLGEQINDNDLIFYSSEGNVFGGGFSVDSELKDSMTSSQFQDSDSIFGKNLVVPPMWFLSNAHPISQSGGNNNHFISYQDDDQVGNFIEEDIHDKLLKISQITGQKDRKRGTAKLVTKKQNKKTRKSKK